MKFLGKLFLTSTVFILIASTMVLAQSLDVSGVVVGEDGLPMVGVSVQVKDKSAVAVQTDRQGRFNIRAAAKDVLRFFYLGFEPQEIAVVKSTTLKIVLKEDVSGLNEVVVVGYGTQSRANLSGAVSSLDQKALKSLPNTNLATVLQGTVTGLRVQQATGAPGSAPEISFRGGTDWDGSGTPLFVVDGVVLPNINGVNLNDIESVDLLKDAASAAIYGARASNGVVLITTKRGKKGTALISYQLKMANNMVRRNPIPYLNGEDYIRWNRQGLASRYAANIADNNNGLATTIGHLTANWGWAANPNNVNSSNSLYSTQLVQNANRHLLGQPGWSLVVDRNPFNPLVKDSILYKAHSFEYFEDLLLQESTLQDHYLNVSGANDQGNFSLGLGAIDDKGMVVTSGFKRLNLNFNGGLNVNKNLKVGLNLSGYNITERPTYVTAWTTAASGGPFQRFVAAAPTLRLNDEITGEVLPGGDASAMGNPLYFKDRFFNNQRSYRFAGGINLEYTIVPALKFLVSGNGLMQFSEADVFRKEYRNGNAGALISTRESSFSRNKEQQYTYNAFLQYDKKFGKHAINTLAGGEYFERKYYTSGAAASGAPSDFIPWLSAATTTVGVPSSSFAAWERLSSIIGRVNYNFDQRYLFNVNLRYDGSSRLEDEKFDLFPGFSAGWNLHNENFFKGSFANKYLSTVKPRVSYGQNGRVTSLSEFQLDAPYNDNGIYNGVTGFLPGAFINTGLKWEKVASLNLGVDLGFAKNRISLMADYFIRDVYDKITSLTIPSWTGFSTYTTNLGQLQNKGIELELKISAIRPKVPGGLSLDFGGNFSKVTNYAKKLVDNGLDGNRRDGSYVWDPATGTERYVGGLYQGQRVGLDEVWAFVYDGIYTTQEQLDRDALLTNTNLPYLNKTLKFLGDARWRDLNGDNIINALDRVYVGRTTPNIMGGFHTSIGYKGFNLYAQFDFAAGHVIIDQTWLRGMAQAQGSANSPEDVKYTYSEYSKQGTLPRFYLGNYGANYIAAANYYQKGDYLAVREVTLSYDTPSKIIETFFKNKIKGVRAYVSGSNLHYFTSYNGTFPEMGGNDSGRFPLPRRITFGLNLSL
ncbi:SusC/RagA family TonB-linked outer membrane protein [Pedobacter sp.]